MKKIGIKAITILLPLIGIGFQMVIVDYTLCKKVQAPLYAVKMENVMDVDAYNGLDYTIYIRYSGAVGTEDEILKGWFRWGE